MAGECCLSGATALQRDTIIGQAPGAANTTILADRRAKTATGHVHTRGEGVVPPRTPAERNDPAAHAGAPSGAAEARLVKPPAYASEEKGWLTPRSAGVPVRICEQAPTW